MGKLKLRMMKNQRFLSVINNQTLLAKRHLQFPSAFNDRGEWESDIQEQPFIIHIPPSACPGPGWSYDTSPAPDIQAPD